MSHVVFYRAKCLDCKHEVEFLSVFPSDALCVECQYKPRKDRKRVPELYGWTVHPGCDAIMAANAEKRAVQEEGLKRKKHKAQMHGHRR